MKMNWMNFTTYQKKRLGELCHNVPEYDGHSILINTFISSCYTPFDVATPQQAYIFMMKGIIFQLINSIYLKTWDSI